jgi:hypothetical protein
MSRKATFSEWSMASENYRRAARMHRRLAEQAQTNRDQCGHLKLADEFEDKADTMLAGALWTGRQPRAVRV